MKFGQIGWEEPLKKMDIQEIIDTIIGGMVYGIGRLL